MRRLILVLLVLPLQTAWAADPGEVARAYRNEHSAVILTEFITLLEIPNVASDTENIRRTAGYIVDRLADSDSAVRTQVERALVRIGETESELTDLIAFRLIPTPVGALVEALLVVPALKGMLVWRHRATRRLLEREPADRSR